MPVTVSGTVKGPWNHHVGTNVDAATKAALMQQALEELTSASSILRRALARELELAREKEANSAVPSMRGVVPHGARGEQLTPNTSRAGVVDDGSIAYPERIEQARRSWPQADAADFEPLDPKGRRWRDLASGTEYKALTGAPLLASGEATRFVTAFFVAGGRMVFLEPDVDRTIHGPVQHVYAQRIGPESPGPDVRIS